MLQLPVPGPSNERSSCRKCFSACAGAFLSPAKKGSQCITHEGKSPRGDWSASTFHCPATTACTRSENSGTLVDQRKGRYIARRLPYASGREWVGCAPTPRPSGRGYSRASPGGPARPRGARPRGRRRWGCGFHACCRSLVKRRLASSSSGWTTLAKRPSCVRVPGLALLFRTSDDGFGSAVDQSCW